MPNPRKNESKDEFIERCMSDEEAKRDFPKSGNRYAFCLSKWTNRNKNEYVEEDENNNE